MADDEPRSWVAVTDPAADAPEGAVLTFPNGYVYERLGDEWCRIDSGCTGVTASWCPIHRDCSCPPGEDGMPTLDDTTCPLHDPTGPHGVWFS